MPLPGAARLRVAPPLGAAREREQIPDDGLRDRHGVRARRRGEPHAALAQLDEERIVDAGAEAVHPAQGRRVAEGEQEGAHVIREEVAGEERDLDRGGVAFEHVVAQDAARRARRGGIELRCVPIHDPAGEQ